MLSNKKEIFETLKEYDNINKKVFKLSQKLDDFEW